MEYADQENIGMIIVATHGQSGIKQWALGSVVEKVVRATTRPVVLIRAKGARPDIRQQGIMNKVSGTTGWVERGRGGHPLC